MINNQPDITILSERQGISSSQLTNMPMYSKVNGVTTGRGNISGKVYIKVIDECDHKSHYMKKVIAEEVYNSEDGDLIIVGYANPLKTLATEAFKASLRYIENELLPDTPHETAWSNIDPEWERETIQRLGSLIKDELDMNPNIPHAITAKLSNPNQ